MTSAQRPTGGDGRHVRSISGSALGFGHTRVKRIGRQVHEPDTERNPADSTEGSSGVVGAVEVIATVGAHGMASVGLGAWVRAEALVRGRPLGRGLVFGVVTSDAPTQPRTHLVWSIVAAALFFLPLGLIAVVFSWRTGRVEAARRPRPGSQELAARRRLHHRDDHRGRARLWRAPRRAPGPRRVQFPAVDSAEWSSRVARKPSEPIPFSLWISAPSTRS